VIENVVLRGDDLNIVFSPWRAVNRANNLRLLPIFAGILAFSFMASFMIDPTPLEVIMVFAPSLSGGLALCGRRLYGRLQEGLRRSPRWR
jgi:hypothetical protein